MIKIQYKVNNFVAFVLQKALSACTIFEFLKVEKRYHYLRIEKIAQ